MLEAWKDFRYALRLLLKTPLITAVAVLSLALGIGANTAIFDLLNALLLRSLPVRDPQQLVSIGGLNPKYPKGSEFISLAMFHEIEKHATVFSDVFVWTGGGMRNIEVNGVRYPGTVDGASGDYFSTLGVRPMIGRVLTYKDAPLDGRPSSQVAVISYGCWQHRFGGNPNVLGKSMRVDGTPVTIVGVSPPNFAGLNIDTNPEATIPIGYSQRRLKYRESMWYSAFGRLKPGVTVAQARAQIAVLWSGILKATVPNSLHGEELSEFMGLLPDVQAAARGNSYLREKFGRPLEILMVLVGAVLVIACVNLANLLLARAAVRQHEFGVRVALGAARWTLIRMSLIESLVLSCTGAALGLLVARWTATYLLASFWTGFVPLSVDASPDARVLAFTMTLALLTGVSFGIVPAFRMSRSDPANILPQSARTMGGRLGRLSRILIAAQVSLSLVLIIEAALFVRTLQNLRNVNLGYRSDHLLMMTLMPQPGAAEIPNPTVYYHKLASRLSGLPGVESVSYLHMGLAGGYEFKAPVSSGAASPLQNAVEEWAGPGFFHMIGMHVLEGREFNWRDNEHTPRVAVVSESLARALFPNYDPIGHMISVGDEPGHQRLTIVGVVNSASLWKFESREPLAIYYPLMQEPRGALVLIRTRVNPLSLAHAVDRSLESLGYRYSLRTETFEQRTARTLVLQRMIAMLASSFSLLALLLASLGIYGVTSYTVTRRTAEIGVRMALGARRADIFRTILGAILGVAVIGVAIAVPVALGCGTFISSMLFGVSAADPTIMAIASSALLTLAAIAAFLPARRASRVDPMVALRHE